MKNGLLMFTGAALGGVVGYFAFFWIARQGFYGLILPGALLGIGACLAPSRSIAPCVLCGVAALALELFSEWKFAPFIKDAGLSYFLAHVHQLRPVTLILICLGAFSGFWFPFRRRRALKPALYSLH
jgi:hypothetical protein